MKIKMLTRNKTAKKRRGGGPKKMKMRPAFGRDKNNKIVFAPPSSVPKNVMSSSSQTTTPMFMKSEP